MTLKRVWPRALLLAVVALILTGRAEAAAILSPVAIAENPMGTFPCCGYTDVSMINQNGLAVGFTSGVTNFDTYIGTAPQHSALLDYEWFSPTGVMSGYVTFDLGAVYSVDRVAAWADEFAGFGTTNVLTSEDGVTFGLVGTFTPTNHLSIGAGGALTYGADVAALTKSNARYVRFEILGPQTPREYDGLGIGEVAFSVSPAVPEPSMLLLAITGAVAAGVRARRRQRRL